MARHRTAGKKPFEHCTTRKENAQVTLKEIEESTKILLNAEDIAPILECDPQDLRCQAQLDPSKLGFPTIVIGRRVKFPRQAFLAFLGATSERS
jgi:hypothetical protein